MWHMNQRSIRWLAVVAGVLVWTVAWASLVHIPITVDDRRTTARFGETLGVVLDRAGLLPQAGTLLAVDGSVVEKAGGGPASVYEGSSRITTAQPVRRPMRLAAFDGLSRLEPYDQRLAFDPAPITVEGHGAFLHVKSIGREGVRLIRTGRASSRRTNHTISVPRPVVFEKTDGHGLRIVALTFDDGPSPYTRDILRILDVYGIKATFFVIGEHIERFPEVLRDVVAAGHVVANHSYSHPAMARMAPAQVEQELRQTEMLIGQHGGAPSGWFRPPMRSISFTLFATAATNGYRVSLWDVDPLDWRKPGSLEIYRRTVWGVTPGSVILLHDGGGDRSQTVTALPWIIDRLLADGYSFVTLAAYDGTFPPR